MNGAFLLPYRGVRPKIHANAFVAPGASVIGDVTIGEQSSIWFSAVLRGDVQPITIGDRTSIQDGSIVHATGGWVPTFVGHDVTVGHGVILHGCTIAHHVLVGMGAIIMDEAEIGENTMIGAGTLVPTKKKIPSGVLALGNPVKVIRDLTPDELKRINDAAAIYVTKCREYREEP